MIRINLLTETGAPSPGGGGVDVVQRVTVACSIILVLTVVVIGWRFWSLRQASLQLGEELASARQEVERLAPVVEQAEALSPPA